MPVGSLQHIFISAGLLTTVPEIPKRNYDRNGVRKYGCNYGRNYSRNCGQAGNSFHPVSTLPEPGYHQLASIHLPEQNTIIGILFAIVALLLGLTVPGLTVAATQSTNHCPAFTATADFRTAKKSLKANPSNWVKVIGKAKNGDEVLLQDGLYKLEQYAVVINKSITLRSASGNRDDVIIEGKGNSVPAEALMVLAKDVQIADITVRNIRDHAVAVKTGMSGTFLYNLHLIDVATGHIKGSQLNGDGTIACSSIGYTGAGSQGDYNGAIDLQVAKGWHIRDNYFYNIWGDGSGCLVDTDCGRYEPGGAPAILLWKDSGDNIIERNVIVNSFRAITLGLGTPYDGGVVRENLIINTESGRQGVHGFIPSDGGISLLPANNVTVENNTILMKHDYRGQIEIRNGTGNVIRNNILSKPVWDRGNAEFNGCGSATGTACDATDSKNTIMNEEDYSGLTSDLESRLENTGLLKSAELVE